MREFVFGGVRGRFLADGDFSYPREFVRQGEEGEAVVLPYRALLLESGGSRVLVDTGAGPSGPDCGRLAEALREAGTDVATIDTVFLTHAHPDHIGGLRTEDGSPAFPRATVMLARKEWDHWRSLAAGGRFGTGEVFGVPEVETYALAWLERYLFSMPVTLVDEACELAPDVRAFACPGHTPGHMGIEIGGQFLYVADLFTLPEQVSDLAWTMPSDADPVELERSRRAVLARAAREGLLLAMCHSRETGRVEAEREQFRWVAATW